MLAISRSLFSRRAKRKKQKAESESSFAFRFSAFAGARY
jgi:hypothetical protein